MPPVSFEIMPAMYIRYWISSPLAKSSDIYHSIQHAQSFVVTVNDVRYPVSTIEGSHRYPCPIEGCGKTYEGRDGLRKHVKDRHNSHCGGSTPAPSAKIQEDCSNSRLRRSLKV
ncbi:hypothetical protein J3R83DRAFT_5821 [Lanmaoa asiatica]|nr:hypothetical protein J3R83DRAFT_5821 [Lanmaoa asiatica]